MISGCVSYRILGFPLKHKFKCPETFEELNPLQLECWAQLVWHDRLQFFDMNAEEVTLTDEEGYLARHLEFARIMMMVPKHIWGIIDLESLRDIVFEWKLTEPFFNDLPTLEENPVTSLGQYYGPKNSEFFSAWEFNFVDALYSMYKKTKSIEHLNRFIALMYRERVSNFNPRSADTNGDIREKFNHKTDDYRMDDIAAQPLRKKLLILFWYENWRMSLSKMFKHVFSKSDSDKTKSSKPVGWTDVLLSASDNISNLEKVKDIEIVILLKDLDRKAKQHKEYERERKKNSKAK